MSEAKTIVTENATAAELPERFRGSIDPAKAVTVVVVEKEERRSEPFAGRPKYLRYWGIGAHRNTSIEDAVRRVRELRDEWDER